MSLLIPSFFSNHRNLVGIQCGSFLEEFMDKFCFSAVLNHCGTCLRKNVDGHFYGVYNSQVFSKLDRQNLINLHLINTNLNKPNRRQRTRPVTL
jgi:hypothetical protein